VGPRSRSAWPAIRPPSSPTSAGLVQPHSLGAREPPARRRGPSAPRSCPRAASRAQGR
jgi:hypothetical protein